MAIMAASIVVYLLLPPPTNLLVVVASQVLSRVASAGLLWMARPAANAELPRISSLGAAGAIATGLLIAWLAGWVLAVVAILVARAVLILAYRSSGGIGRESLGWARQVTEILILIIGHSRVGSL
jgi:hypothetical protein